MPIVTIEELVKPLTPTIEKNQFDWKEMILNEIKEYNTKVKIMNEQTRRNNDKKINHQEV